MFADGKHRIPRQSALVTVGEEGMETAVRIENAGGLNIPRG